jgi:hypothetical protein
MRRYSREEALRTSGARREDLDDLEARRLLIPYRSRRYLGAFGSVEEYYTEGQIGVLLWLLKTRRAVEASQR